MKRLLFTWKLDGGVMVLDSQRPAIGSPISDKDEVSAAKVKVLFTIDIERCIRCRALCTALCRPTSSRVAYLPCTRPEVNKSVRPSNAQARKVRPGLS
jgi:hypothetical protein